jgi:dipeptidyl aminopeptidase/acylaminoacyl peptidase
MRVVRYAALVAIAAAAVASGLVAEAQSPKPAPLYRQFLSPPTPLEMVAARKVDRIAWMAYDEGKRNVYTAAAPAFTPVRLTAFLEDDGVDLTAVRISDNGSIVTFIRGTQPNREGWIANASADPDGADRTIWAVRTTGGPAWRLAEIAGAPELAPDGSSVLFVKDGQIHRTTTAQVRPANPRDRGEKPFITAWGEQSNPKWSPDGRKIAFVSNRVDHGFVVVYDTATRTIEYMAPGVDFDSSPMWTADSRHVVFVRRPGLPFGQQAQQGVGSLGNPNGPAFNPNAPTGRGGRGQGARGQGANPNVPADAAKVPGLTRATFRGGYSLSIMKADAATGEAAEVWHNEPNDRLVGNLVNPRLAGNHIVFPFNVAFGGGRGGRGAQQEAPSGPVDEWERYYSLDLSSPSSRPVLLTTTDGMIEGQTDVALSPDGETLYYCTNAKDIERRHIWAVPVAGGAPQQLTTGTGIETSPTPLASGTLLATFSAGWKLPQSVGLWTFGAPNRTASEGRGLQTPARIIFPSLKNWRAADLHVEPELVITKAADGLEIHNQLFVPKDIKPGERRPAIVFVHGGPVRQMLLGYHYMHFYHWAYGINQWLASQGYVVMSINFRSGVGYGRSFRTAPNTGGNGNAEYQDVLAGGTYLQSRPDVDPNRVGIWGLSYGGVLTAQALARNSDIFKAGVDLAGVHLWGSSLDPEATSYKSSVIGAIDGWKSPVLLVHGDDDRNVAFQQTTGLVQLLRARAVEFELIVFPDDTHESMLHSRWVHTLDRMEKFLKKHLGAAATRITTGGR